MEVCERASGARMHTALYKPFSFDATVFNAALVQDLLQFLSRCGRSLSGAFLGLLNNRSFKSRLSFIGQVSQSRAQSYGLSGLMLRSGGVFSDLRAQGRQSYGLYRNLSLRIFLGKRGDNLDRFIIRVKETAESFRLLSQLLQRLNSGVLLRVPANVFDTLTAHIFLQTNFLYIFFFKVGTSFPYIFICQGWHL